MEFDIAALSRFLGGGHNDDFRGQLANPESAVSGFLAGLQASTHDAEFLVLADLLPAPEESEPPSAPDSFDVQTRLAQMLDGHRVQPGAVVCHDTIARLWADVSGPLRQWFCLLAAETALTLVRNTRDEQASQSTTIRATDSEADTHGNHHPIHPNRVDALRAIDEQEWQVWMLTVMAGVSTAETALLLGLTPDEVERTRLVADAAVRAPMETDGAADE